MARLLLAALLVAASPQGPPEAGPSGAPAVADEIEPVLAPVVVRAPVRTTPPRDTSAQVSVIDTTERAGESPTLAQFVRAAPGVATRDLGGGQAVTLSIRGSTSDQVVVTLEGLPLNSAAGGGTDLGLLPVAFLDRVEVVRGAVGARYGGGALGGAVELHARPATASPRLAIEAAAGAFGRRSLAAAATTAAGGGAFLVVAAANRADGDFAFPIDWTPQLEGDAPDWATRANNDQRGAALLARYAARGNGRDVDVLLLAAAREHGIPGAMRNPSLVDRESQAQAAGALRARQRFELGRLDLRTFGRAGTLEIGRIGEPRPGAQHESLVGADLTAAGAFGRHAIEIGASAIGQALDGPFHGSRGRTVLALTAADDVVLGRFTITPAARLESTDGRLDGAAKIGAVADLARGLTIRVNAGRAFRAPSLSELYLEQGGMQPNPALRPERAVYADASVEVAVGSLSLAAGGFGTLYEDLISYELYERQKVRPMNFFAAAVVGAEMAAEAKLGPLRIAAAYTLARSLNLMPGDAFHGRDLPYHQRHRLNARAALGLGRAVLHADLDAQSELHRNRTSDHALPARALVDAGVGLCLVPEAGLWAHLEISNVFDARTEDFYGYPLPGRAAMVVVRVTPGDSSKGGTP